jgi:hypothetical protein
MTSWSLKLPMRDPDEPLDVDAITDLPAALETRSEQQIARELLLAARLDGGFQTVGGWGSTAPRRSMRVVKLRWRPRAPA